MQWHDPGFSQYYKPYRERGGCLLIWLIFVIGGSSLAILAILAGGPQAFFAAMAPIVPPMPSWYWPFDACLLVARLISVIGIAMWKKWGVYGFFGVGIFEGLIGMATSGLNIVLLIAVAIHLGIGWLAFGPYMDVMD
jgi:hypothetical protein